ncbi:MAG: tetratricopeptide repeat protein, partial [Chitinophagaceae bacterium]
MKSYYTLCFFFFKVLIIITFSSSAQYDPSKINKKAVETYNVGLARALDGKYKEAIMYLQAAISIEPKYIDAYLSLAGVFGQTKDYQQSVATYEKAFALDTNSTADYRLPYSINLAGLGQFEKAVATIQSLLGRDKLNPNTKKAAEY